MCCVPHATIVGPGRWIVVIDQAIVTNITLFTVFSRWIIPHSRWIVSRLHPNLTSSLGCIRTWHRLSVASEPDKIGKRLWSLDSVFCPSPVSVGPGHVADRPSIVWFVGVPAVTYPSNWASVDGIFEKILSWTLARAHTHRKKDRFTSPVSRS